MIDDEIEDLIRSTLRGQTGRSASMSSNHSSPTLAPPSRAPELIARRHASFRLNIRTLRPLHAMSATRRSWAPSAWPALTIQR